MLTFDRMPSGNLDAASLLALLREDTRELRVPRGKPIVDAASALHLEAHDALGDLYPLAGVGRGVARTQRSRVLLTLLRSSREGLSAEARGLRDRVVVALVATLPEDDVLTVFLALRRLRANHKHVTHAVLQFVETRDADLLTRRRAALVDVIEHALGRNVARGLEKHLLAPSRTPESDAHLEDRLGRFTRSRTTLERRLAILFEGGTDAALVPAFRPTALLEQSAPRPKTVTLTNRGDISATLVHIYRGADSEPMRTALDAAIARAAESLPTFEGRLAVVVDASLSTRGHGERELAFVSQSWALAQTLKRRCPRMQTFMAGGAGEPPVPRGATDLVMPLLDAVETDPDVVAIVTDGYENRLGGELARVLAALPGAGIDVPVVVCTSMFTAKDDLSLRSPAPNVPHVGFSHEDDFAAVLETIGSAARGEAGTSFLRSTLLARLETVERSLSPWIPPSHGL